MRKGRGVTGNRLPRTIAVMVGAIFLAVACGETQDDSEDGDEAGDAGAPTGLGGSRGGRNQGGDAATATGGKPRGGTGGVVAIGGTGATGGTGGDTGGVGATGGTGGDTGGVGATGGTRGDTGGVGATGGGGDSGASGAGGTSGASGGKGGSGASVGGFGGGGGASAGKAGASGSGGSAGSSTSCETVFTVGSDGFVRAPGASSGCWHGYAYAGGDTGSLVMPTSFAMCGTGCVLRTSGTLGPATAANAYAGVVFLGFNLNQAAGGSTVGTVTPRGSSLVVTYVKAAGPAVIRAQIQAGTTRWCATLVGSPATIAYATFNTACWDGSGTSYAKQPIEAFQLMAPGTETSQPFDVTVVSIEDR